MSGGDGGGSWASSEATARSMRSNTRRDTAPELVAAAGADGPTGAGAESEGSVTESEGADEQPDSADAEPAGG